MPKRNARPTPDLNAVAADALALSIAKDLLTEGGLYSSDDAVRLVMIDRQDRRGAGFTVITLRDRIAAHLKGELGR